MTYKEALELSSKLQKPMYRPDRGGSYYFLANKYFNGPVYIIDMKEKTPTGILPTSEQVLFEFENTTRCKATVNIEDVFATDWKLLVTADYHSQ